MNYTLRRFLQDLFQAFTEQAESEGIAMHFVLRENMLQRHFEISSSVSSFTILTPNDTSELSNVVDLRGYIYDDIAPNEVALAEETVERGSPYIMLAFSQVKFNEPETYLDLYNALTTHHAFRASRNLMKFSRRSQEVDNG